jgi:thiol:disulfide interchange protein DsbG
MTVIRRRAFVTVAVLGAACSDNKPATSAPLPAGPAAQKAYEAAQKASGFGVGPIVAANTVYIFFDTACPHCAHLWEQSQPLAKRVRFVWVPVGFLRKTSAPQGATILTAADPAAAMAHNEASVLQRGPGIEIAAALPADAVARVEANTKVLEGIGADSVPFIVFRHAKSGQYGTHSGALATADLAALIGV